jgi:hypothetical protein
MHLRPRSGEGAGTLPQRFGARGYVRTTVTSLLTVPATSLNALDRAISQGWSRRSAWVFLLIGPPN